LGDWPFAGDSARADGTQLSGKARAFVHELFRENAPPNQPGCYNLRRRFLTIDPQLQPQIN